MKLWLGKAAALGFALLALGRCGASQQGGGHHSSAPSNSALGMPDGHTLATREHRPAAKCMPWDNPPWTPTTLVTSEKQYRELFRCQGPNGPIEPLPSGIDFEHDALGVFVAMALASQPHFERLVDDRGKLVAVFTASGYCGGAPPPQVATGVALLVPAGVHPLDVKIYTPHDPSCDGPPRP
jgi:hypothetical protein